MPTQRRILPPANINRFNYVNYMRPSRFSSSGREPARHFLHKQFELLRNLPEHDLVQAFNRKGARISADFDWDTLGKEDPAEVLPPLGMNISDFLMNRQFHALQYLVEHDKEWEQYSDTYKVFALLKTDEQKELRNLERKKWHHKSMWNWDLLLGTIARDQKFFREVLIEGPTKAGLVGTSVAYDELLWEKHAFSETTARRIYKTYSSQLSHLLGVGALAPSNLRAELRLLGYVDAKGRFPGRPLEKMLAGKPPAQLKRFSDIGVHFFAHALRNLQNWRYGRKPLPWTPYECLRSCLELQQRLVPRPPSP